VSPADPVSLVVAAVLLSAAALLACHLPATPTRAAGPAARSE
jgi:hypothetical protein